jgi:GTP diphosphokinase / guanosine-3',5'-bis(diphosphate) 3'-diphosphatase
MRAGSCVITPDDLVALVRNYNPNCDEDLIRRAWDYGAAMHEGQTRHSGEPYFTHPVAVASILTEMRLDDATIVTALLHDTVEDTRSTHAEITRLFGAEIAELVDGVTKLTNLQLSSSEAKQAENFRKLLIAMSRDLRVILVKLADRLHNMRTIRSMRPDKQARRRARRWTSTPRSPAGWACSGCARSSRIWPSASSTPRRATPSCAASSCCSANRAT